MLRLAVLSLSVAVPALAQPPAPAPAAPRFKWESGKVLAYRVVQTTTVKETVLEEKTEKPVTTEARTSLVLVRKWTVKDVDKDGVATLEMSITEMKQEFRQPDGMNVVVDSAKPEDAKNMTAFLNKPIVTVRIDPQGKLVEVKEAKGGAARLQAELPFRLTLPDAAPAAGQAWDRPFAVKLDPPNGTGESYDFTQKYVSKGATKEGLLVVGVETALKAPPKTTGEQVPLVPMLWTGDVYFNTVAGKYHAARLTAKAELANHQGEGTKFVYESTYSEDAIEK